MRSITTKSKNGRFFCVHHPTAYSSNKSLATSILEHLQDIWKGPDPVPGWVVNITVASIAFVSMLISMLTLCCGLCVNWEKKSDDEKDKDGNVIKNTTSSLYTKVEKKPGFFSRMFSWCRRSKPKLSEEQKLYKSIEMTSRPLRKEAREKKQLVICTPDETLYAPYDSGITKSMVANLSKLPANTKVTEKKPSTSGRTAVVTFSTNRLPKLHKKQKPSYASQEQIKIASDSPAPSAPLLDTVDNFEVATIFTKGADRAAASSGDSDYEREQMVVSKVKHSKKDSKGRVKSSHKN